MYRTYNEHIQPHLQGQPHGQERRTLAPPSKINMQTKKKESIIIGDARAPNLSSIEVEEKIKDVAESELGKWASSFTARESPRNYTNHIAWNITGQFDSRCIDSLRSFFSSVAFKEGVLFIEKNDSFFKTTLENTKISQSNNKAIVVSVIILLIITYFIYMWICIHIFGY